MNKLLLTIAFIIGSVSFANAGTYEVSPSAKESIEWCDIWISHANETNLPRVLLIGDSITRAYYPEVETKLAGKAYVGRLSSSAFISDPVLLKQIEMVLSEYKFDVIHFNNGMHGWQHSEAEYRAAFPKILETIRAHAPAAKLVWATTTSLKESKPNNSQEASDERIAARNAISLECIKGKNIAVDDLNALVRGHPKYHRDNVHFNADGIRLEAAQVAASIEPLLAH
jgi:hypothetical protein